MHCRQCHQRLLDAFRPFDVGQHVVIEGIDGALLHAGDNALLTNRRGNIQDDDGRAGGGLEGVKRLGQGRRERRWWSDLALSEGQQAKRGMTDDDHGLRWWAEAALITN